jgi:putative nucleotidyltransferase with HDIG domain
MMKRNRIYYLSNQHNLFVKLFLFGITALLIVWCMPDEGMFRYSFAKGKVWRYETLNAPFTFGILKSEAELQEDWEEIKQNTKKIYRYDESLTNERIELLKSKLDSIQVNSEKGEQLLKKSIEPISSEGITALKGKIQYWYKQGITGQENKETTLKTGEIIERNDDGIKLKSGNFYLNKNLLIDSIALFLYGSTQWEDVGLRDFFNSKLLPNVQFDEALTEASIQDAVNSLSKTRGLINKGEPLIRKGEIIDERKFQLLISLQNEYENTQGIAQVSIYLLKAGQSIIVILLLLFLYLFILFLRTEIFEDSIKLTLISLLIIAAVGSTSFVINSNIFSEYLIPFCTIPIIIRSFFDTRLALFTYLISMLIVSVLVPNSFDFFIIQILGGISVVFTALNLRQRSRLFTMIITLVIVYCSAYCGLRLLSAGSLDAIDSQKLIALSTSSALTLVSFPLIYFIERVFGYTSDISLLELSDTNSTLLREMAIKAPGTFQHSLQVANLSEAAIGVIGGNMLLARTGALYHDIGKIEFSRYFIENQNTGVNPHDELDFDESAQLIISHVQRGLRLGRKHKLPDRVLDFIRTHHGTSRVHYFYKSFLKNYPEEEVDEAAFRYPGPIPFSRETAVVMMADSVEARSRSLTAPSKEQIGTLVDDVIQRQMDDQQYINADITLRDISRIKKVFKKMLMEMHHVRIAFPD